MMYISFERVYTIVRELIFELIIFFQIDCTKHKMAKIWKQEHKEIITNVHTHCLCTFDENIQQKLKNTNKQKKKNNKKKKREKK